MNKSSFISIESTLLLSLYVFVAITSIVNIGVIAPLGFIILFFLCVAQKPRTGLIASIMLFYLPKLGIHLSSPITVSLVIIMGWNIKLIVNSTGFNKYKKLILLFSIFILLRFLSVAYIKDMDLFLYYFFFSTSTLLHIIVMCKLITKEEDADYIEKWWCYIGAMACILGYIHFYFSDFVYQNQVATARNLISKGAIDVSRGIWIRWIWAGVEPNIYAFSLIIPFSLSLSFMIKKYSFFNIVIWALCFLAIIGTYSRTSIIISFLIFVLIIFSSKMKNKFVTIIIVSLSLFGIYYYFPDFVERINTISTNLEVQGGSGRTIRWKEAFDNFSTNTIFGIGTGQSIELTKTHNDSHNTFLQILAENGIFVFFFFIYIWLDLLKKAINIDYSYMIITIAIILNLNAITCFDMRIMSYLFILIYFKYSINIKKQLRIMK